MVDTGAEFASPSGAPLGYEPGGPVGEVLRGAKEQQALVERVVQSGQRRLARVWLVFRDGVHVRVERDSTGVTGTACEARCTQRVVVAIEVARDTCDRS